MALTLLAARGNPLAAQQNFSGPIAISSNGADGGPVGVGSLISLVSGSAAIQENWGINLFGGGANRPVKVIGSSLLVGFSSSGVNFGTGNLLVQGDVGFGTTSPAGKLQIDQNYNSSPSLKLNQPVTTWGTTGFFRDYRYIQTSSAALDGEFKQFNVGAGGIAIGYSTTPVYGSGDALYVNGNVGIGTSSPQNRLSVNGTVQAKEVIVNTGWADYVFDPDFRLRPLHEVREFVRTNHHLPDLPSAEEVNVKGISLGDMQSKLLAKIEELTLYLIKAEDRNLEMSKRIAKLEAGN